MPHFNKKSFQNLFKNRELAFQGLKNNWRSYGFACYDLKTGVNTPWTQGEKRTYIRRSEGVF